MKLRLTLFSCLNICLTGLLDLGNPIYAQMQPSSGDTGIPAFIRKTVVLIETPSGHGSGTIVGKIGNELIIVTAKHVVSGVAQGESIRLVNASSKVIASASKERVFEDPNYDLAIIYAKSESKDCFLAADIGARPQAWLRQAREGSGVFVSGYSSTDLNRTSKPSLRMSNGSITNILESSEAKDGYQFSYSAITARGMSGGGVFVWPGYLALVGIHGSGERDSQRQDSKTGFNYGIPMDKLIPFLKKTLGRKSDSFEYSNIQIRRVDHPHMAIDTLCKNPFGQWSCQPIGDEKGNNYVGCILGDPKMGKQNLKTYKIYDKH